MKDHVRAERRADADRVARKRWSVFNGYTNGWIYAWGGYGVQEESHPRVILPYKMTPLGMYRKFNGACGCRICKMCRDRYKKSDRVASKAEIQKSLDGC